MIEQPIAAVSSSGRRPIRSESFAASAMPHGCTLEDGAGGGAELRYLIKTGEVGS